MVAPATARAPASTGIPPFASTGSRFNAPPTATRTTPGSLTLAKAVADVPARGATARAINATSRSGSQRRLIPRSGRHDRAIARPAISPSTAPLTSMRVAQCRLTCEAAAQLREGLVVDGRKVAGLECVMASFFEEGLERPHHARVELSALVLLQLFHRSFVTHGFPVDTIRGHRLICVRHDDDAGAERDLVPTEAIGIAGTVVVLMVVQDDRHQGPQCRRRLDDRRPIDRVKTHERRFVGIEPHRFQENPVLDA